jgi:electron transport complex protein RnfC
VTLAIANGFIVFPALKRELSAGLDKARRMPPPARAVIPLAQHEGEPALPVVREGERVCVGTLLGAPNGHFSAAVHSSVSGKVTGIVMAPHPSLGRALAVAVESDGEDRLDPEIGERTAESFSLQDMADIIRSAGIVGLSGNARPTHLKFSRPVRTVILNGMESEPYLAADYIVMMERTQELIQGARLVREAVGAERVLLAVGEDKVEALEMVNSRLFTLGENFLESVLLPARYPQGEERRLAESLLGEELPGGWDPVSSGILVLNVSTVIAIYEALRFGKPLYERVVTITGECIAQPANLIARVGTPVEELVRACQGALRPPGKWIAGGPMTGVELPSLKAPVVKGMRAVVALPVEEIRRGKVDPCIRCGLCVEACPVFLNPCMITLAVEAGRTDLASEFGVDECVPCGNCTYVCPAHRPMMDLMMEGKARR